jgi:hypothetical protein
MPASRNRRRQVLPQKVAPQVTKIGLFARTPEILLCPHLDIAALAFPMTVPVGEWNLSNFLSSY